MTRGADQPVQQRRAQGALQLRERLRQDECSGVRIAGLQRVRVRLVEAAADEHVRDETAQALLAGQPPEQLPTQRQRRGDLLEPEARHLLHQVDLAPDIARAPVRHAEVPLVVGGKAQPNQALALLGVGDGNPDDLFGTLGT